MRVTLAQGQTASRALAGSQFYFKNGDGEIKIKLNSGGNTKTYELTPGQLVRWEGARFFSLEIKNTSADQEIEFYVYEHDVHDNKIPNILQVEITKATDGETVADDTIADAATVTIAADSTRRKLVVWNDIDGSGHIRVGYDAAAGVGYKLQPGGSYTFESTRSVSIHNDSGSTQTFGYSIETD